MSKPLTLFTHLTEKKHTEPFTLAAQQLLNLLGVQADVLKGSNGSGGYEGIYADELIFLFANARNMALASKAGKNILCSDDLSYRNFMMTKQILEKDAAKKGQVNQMLSRLELTYDGCTEMVHIIDLFMEHFNEGMLKNPFKEFRVALHYGNDYARMGLSRDTETMHKAAQMLGANVYPVATSRQITGYEMLLSSEDMAFKASGTVLLDCIDSSADFILTNNAASFFMLDTQNSEGAESVNRETAIPVLNFAQMACLALGNTDKKALGLDQHTISVQMV